VHGSKVRVTEEKVKDFNSFGFSGRTGEETGRAIREAQDMNLLEVENLRTYFNTEAGVARAVDGVSFALEEGESLALVG